MVNSVNTVSLAGDWMYKFFVSSQYSRYRHVSMIVFITLVVFSFQPQFIEPFQSVIGIGLIVALVLLFYLNMYWFVPKFFFKSRYTDYAILIIITIAIIVFIYFKSWEILAKYRRADAYREAASVLSVSFIILVLTMSSTAIKLFQRAVVDSMRINELEKASMRAEMEQLKNQINPHFLFNMLNNVNVLTQKDPHKASQVLMKLSDLLRYQLYDSARTSVLLTADIHFLEDFLNLEKTRRDSFEYLVSKQGDLSGIQMAPLLFITFVENAVKHNMDSEKQSYVQLYFTVHNRVLHFKCINSKPRITVSKSNVGGLGLANVKRRLELIYPEKHLLIIDDQPDTYTASLTIQL
ncbi:MAG: histidine kinase [Cyclobacteriaceae bacterium]|nr:histidine kinase [Cyclobacteriaceae bacterium]